MNLNEYFQFVFYAKTYSEEKGIEGFKEAIEYCIEHDILSEYLKMRRHELYNFLVAEYDYDLDMKMQGEEKRRIAFKEGIKKGIKEGIKEGEKNAKIALAKMMKQSKYSILEIIKLTGLTQEEIENLKI